ncbi:MAG: hypothetical protein ACPLW8_05140 [Candidatus Bathyarchaeales archaeon]
MRPEEIILESIATGIFVFLAVYFSGKYADERLINKLLMARAETPETAVRAETIGITGTLDKLALKRLAKEGKLAVTEDGRYYVRKA